MSAKKQQANDAVTPSTLNVQQTPAPVAVENQSDGSTKKEGLVKADIASEIALFKNHYNIKLSAIENSVLEMKSINDKLSSTEQNLSELRDLNEKNKEHVDNSLLSMKESLSAVLAAVKKKSNDIDQLNARFDHSEMVRRRDFMGSQETLNINKYS